MLDYKYVLNHIAQWIAQKGQFGGLDMHKMLLPAYHVSKVMIYNKKGLEEQLPDVAKPSHPVQKKTPSTKLTPRR